MQQKNPKKTSHSKLAHILFCALFYAILASFVAGLFAFSANYQKIYSSPEVVKGSADFTGVDLRSRKVECILSGEWEFFYNRWIITDDEIQAEPDGLLTVPGHWTKKNFGGSTLPKSGYASYRIMIYNVQEGVDVTVFRIRCTNAYRIFINGQLVTRSGELSKNPSETSVTGRLDKSISYISDGSPLEVVIELSATSSGGISAAPWLGSRGTSSAAYGSKLRNFSAAALGVTTIAVLLSVLTFIFFRYMRDISMPLCIVLLYVHFLFSKDMLYFLGLPYGVAVIPEILSAVAVFCAFVWHFYRTRAAINKKLNLICGSIALVAVAAFIALAATDFSAIPAFLIIATACVYLYPLISNTKIHPALRGVYGVLFIFMLSVFCFELADLLGLIVFGTEFIFSVEMMLMIACFAVLGLWRIAASAKEAMRASKLERELFHVKQQALKAQIKPHFVFNSLTAIQSLYRSSLKEGDEALEHFARHLRLNIDSDGDDLIPFDDEVRNILNYFELENLRAGGNLTLLLDINYSDFNVPVLSLQPLVENAILYAETEKIKDGYIMLYSALEDGVIVIKVTDNGKGFDPANTSDGIGLENTKKRFEGIFGASVNVKSEHGKGTEITISIPLEEK